MAISLRNKKGRFGAFIGGLNFRLTVVTLILALIPLFILRGVILNNTWDSLLHERIDKMREQGKYLTAAIISGGYFDSKKSSDVIEGQVNQLSSVYDGRVVIINEDFRVVKDSYSRITNKYVISTEALSAMNGTDTTEYSENYNLINMAMGVRASEEADPTGVIIISSSTTDINELFGSISRTSIYILIVSAVIITLLILLFSRLITAPFKRISSSINSIAEGDYSQKVDFKGYSELRVLSDSFNGMLDKIEQTEKSRQEFVSNVSHELKTPITSIKVLADALYMQDDVPNETYKEFMQDIVFEIDREDSIINDLLSLVKLDKTAAEMNITPVNIHEMLELIIKRLKPIAGKRNVELALSGQEDIIALCDEVKLTLAFSNLIENGIKYNVAGGYVRTELKGDSEKFVITVEDSGIGIPEENLDKIFERFYRVDKARSRETGGTGLGLSITKNIIDLHNGTIDVKSILDQGTTFVVTIPIVYRKEESDDEK